MILAVLLGMGCSGKTVVECVCTAFPSGDSTVVKAGHKETIYDCCNDKFAITLKEVNDSRCPSQLVCVWAGTAFITITLNNNPAQLLELEINKPKTVRYLNHEYTLELKTLTPYPEFDYPDLGDYEATITVSRI